MGQHPWPLEEMASPAQPLSTHLHNAPQVLHIHALCFHDLSHHPAQIAELMMGRTCPCTPVEWGERSLHVQPAAGVVIAIGNMPTPRGACPILGCSLRASGLLHGTVAVTGGAR